VKYVLCRPPGVDSGCGIMFKADLFTLTNQIDVLYNDTHDRVALIVRVCMCVHGVMYV
jgi:hypothetical protein